MTHITITINGRPEAGQSTNEIPEVWTSMGNQSWTFVNGGNYEMPRPQGSLDIIAPKVKPRPVLSLDSYLKWLRKGK